MFKKKEGLVPSETKSRSGFTLIELLVVIAIIAILASIALLSLGPAQKAGRDARRIADLRQMQSILQLYYNKCGYYPGSGAPVGSPCEADANTVGGSGNNVPDTTISGQGSWNETTGLADVLAETGLLVTAASIPNDPIGSKSYTYGRNADGSSYVLQAILETENSVLKNDIDGFVYGVDCDDGSNAYCIQF